MENDLCCVCGAHLKVQQGRIVVEQSTNIISLIWKSIAPRIVSENDYICQSCYKRVLQTLKEAKPIKVKETNVGLNMEVFEDTELSSNGKSSRQTDRNVCLMCDTLLSTRQSILIVKHNPTELDQLMLNIISEVIPPEIKIGSEDKVCSKCWSKVKRSAIHLQQINELDSNSSSDGNESVEIKSEPGSDQVGEIEIQDSEFLKSNCEDGSDGSKIDKIIDNCDFTIKPPVNDEKQENNGYEYLSDLDPQVTELRDDLLNDPDFTAKIPINNKYSDKQMKMQNEDGTPDEIVLPSYKRAGNTARHCLFPKCKNLELKKIRDEIRAKLINHYKIYIPLQARLCKEHLLSNDWNFLQELDCSRLKFNANHIENMFSMVREKKGIDIDFSDVLKLDDSIIQYLLGTTRDTLASILTREPQILTRPNGIKGLIALFIRHENGSSKLRISQLLKVPRQSLHSAMDVIQEILSNSPATKELGLEHILLTTPVAQAGGRPPSEQ